MHTAIRSGRFYFWPIISANVVTMTLAVGADPIRALAFSVVLSCLASFGFLLNDLWDRDVDRINEAKHFENSDATTIGIGVGAGVVFLVAGLGFAYWLGPMEFLLSSGIAASLGAYTLLLRRLLFMPTIAAALLASSPLWAPLVLWGSDNDSSKVVFVTAIMLILAARETLMDARDRLGDVVGGRDTLATVFGERIPRYVGVILTVGAGVPFVVAVTSSASGLPTVAKLAVTAIGGTILYLLMKPAIGTLAECENQRAAIQKYVLSSRVAMALIPLLNLILWRL